LKNIIYVFVLFIALFGNEKYISFKTDKYIDIKQTNKDKVFIREYTYHASDTDSKVSSRKKAIRELKNILSEEIGVYIQSSFDMKQNLNDKYVKQEIHQLSASITHLKILDEKWNGEIYYIKASVKINPDEVMNLLLEAIKAKASQKDIKRLNKILAEQKRNLNNSYEKIQQLQKKLLLQEIKNQAKQKELAEIKRKLRKLEKERSLYEKKLKQQKKELVKIKNIIREAKNRIQKENKKVCLLVKGMTKREIIKILGLPKSDNWYKKVNIDCKDNPIDIEWMEKGYSIRKCNIYYKTIMHSYSDKWYYGDKIIHFDNNIVNYVEGCR